MTRSDMVAYCLSKPGAWLDEPWEGDEVVKVSDKIFAFLGSADASGKTVGLKCGRTADEAGELRARYPEHVTASAYVGRYGWNTIAIAALPADELRELIDGSYDAAIADLPKAKRPT